MAKTLETLGTASQHMGDRVGSRDRRGGFCGHRVRGCHPANFWNFTCKIWPGVFWKKILVLKWPSLVHSGAFSKEFQIYHVEYVTIHKWRFSDSVLWHF